MSRGTNVAASLHINKQCKNSKYMLLIQTLSLITKNAPNSVSSTSTRKDKNANQIFFVDFSFSSTPTSQSLYLVSNFTPTLSLALHLFVHL